MNRKPSESRLIMQIILDRFHRTFNDRVVQQIFTMECLILKRVEVFSMDWKRNEISTYSHIFKALQFCRRRLSLHLCERTDDHGRVIKVVQSTESIKSWCCFLFLATRRWRCILIYHRPASRTALPLRNFQLTAIMSAKPLDEFLHRQRSIRHLANKGKLLAREDPNEEKILFR